MRPVMTKAAVLAGCALPWLSACGGATTPAHPTGTAATAQATASASPAPTDPAPAGTQSVAAPTGAQLTAALPPLPPGAQPFIASTGPNGLLDPAG